MAFVRLNRTIHKWGALVAALPFLVILLSGILLQFKKEIAWIQPPEVGGSGGPLRIGFDRILAAARQAEEAGVEAWEDVDRIDVRPGKGMCKLQARSGWEVQVDTATGDILQVAYRRSDLVENIHDGTFFHAAAKHWLFFPAALLLLLVWITGLYLFLRPFFPRRERPGYLKLR